MKNFTTRLQAMTTTTNVSTYCDRKQILLTAGVSTMKKIEESHDDGKVINITDKTARLYENFINDMEHKDFNLVRDMDLDAGHGLWDAETKMFLDAVTLKGLFFSEDWVYICTDLVAKKISTQPLRVMRSLIKDGKYVAEPAVSHPVQKILENPNKWQDYHAFMYVTAVDLCLVGNFITWIGQNKDFLMPIPAESVSLDFDREGRARGYLVTESSSESVGLQRTNVNRFPIEQIAHGRQANPSSMLWGLSSFTPLRKAVLFNRYTSEYLNNFYLKGATPGIALEMSSDANEHVALRLLRSFENAYTGRRNQRRTLVMPKGVTAKPISHSLADQQLKDFINLNRETIINALKIPKHELSLQAAGSLGSEEHKTSLKNFWAATLNPMMKTIAGTLTKHLQDKLGPAHYLEFDVTDVEVLQESLETKAKLAKEMLATKTLNEVRAEVWNLAPLSGGDYLPGTTPYPSSGGGEVEEPAQPAMGMLTKPEEAQQPQVSEVQNTDAGVAENLSAVAPETKDIIPKGAAKAANFIKANKDWFEQRERKLAKGTGEAIDKMQGAALALMTAMAPAMVNSVRVGLEELGYSDFQTKAEDDKKPKADIVSKTEMRRRLQKVNGSFEEKWTENYVKYLEAVVDLGYNAQLSIPFKLPNPAELAALQARGTKRRREILEARGMDTFASMSKTTTEKVLSLVEQGVEEGKSVDQISQDIGSYMRNNAEEIGARAMTIARTETLTASSLGQAAAMQDASKVIPDLKKMWVNAGDDRVRGNPSGLYPKSEADHWELQGEVRSWDDDFSNGLSFPRDPSGDVHEVINCRCTFITLPSDEMDKIPENLESDSKSFKGGPGSGRKPEGGSKPESSSDSKTPSPEEFKEISGKMGSTVETLKISGASSVNDEDDFDIDDSQDSVTYSKIYQETAYDRQANGGKGPTGESIRSDVKKQLERKLGKHSEKVTVDIDGDEDGSKFSVSLTVQKPKAKGGPGSGRPSEGGPKPEGGKLSPHKGEMASRAENGQIKISKPKNAEQATKLLTEVEKYHDEAQSAYKKDPSPQNAMRAAHATSQLSRAIGYGQTIARSS